MRRVNVATERIANNWGVVMRVGRWVGIAGAILLAAGFVLVSSAPGGGEVDESDFEKFYVTDDNTALPIIGVVLLSLGLIALLWFFYGLRTAMRGEDPVAGFAFASAAVGLAVFGAGASMLVGPSGAQAFSDAEFVGAPVAHALAQAGYAAMLVPGALLLGSAVAAFSAVNRRVAVVPGWVSIVGFVAAALQVVAWIWIPFFAIPLWIILAAATTRRSATASSDI